MELFFVAVLLSPTRKEVDEQGLGSKLIVEPKAVLAKDEAHAGAKALGLVPDEYANVAEERLDIRVLSFRSVRAAVGAGR